jgi:hypothetical protein
MIADKQSLTKRIGRAVYEALRSEMSKFEFDIDRPFVREPDLNVAQSLLRSFLGENPRAPIDYKALYAPRSTPRRQRLNIKTVTVDGEEVRLTRAERKRLARVRFLGRERRPVDPKFLPPGQRAAAIERALEAQAATPKAPRKRARKVAA